MSGQYDYDAIIIGAGIGGLVCGCYLAKAGMKVLIVEKNFKVGGLCTSFKRGGVLFDACVHTIGSCRRDGIITSILKDLGLDKEISFLRMSPLRLVISEDKRFEIDANPETTIDNITQYSPEEKNKLKRFFDIVINEEYIKLASKVRDLTFKQFFETFISNKEINNLFSFLMFQSAGLPSDLISALFGIILLRDYIIDGGYYLNDSNQVLADKFKNTFIKLGGTILLNSEVERIILKRNNSIVRIKLRKETINANILVSNIDVVRTLEILLGVKQCSEILKSLLRMKPSLSCFSLYLKLNKDPLFSSYVHFINLKKDVKNHVYNRLTKNDFSNIYLDCFFSKYNNYHKATISLLVPFNNKKFWTKYKINLAEKILKEFMDKINFTSEDIEVKEIITPISFYNWTYAYKGASYGWAPLITQVFPKFKLLPISNLYFVGHWLGMGHGISTVAYLGRNVANTILNSVNKP